jgi:hypothetical protein
LLGFHTENFFKNQQSFQYSEKFWQNFKKFSVFHFLPTEDNNPYAGLEGHCEQNPLRGILFTQVFYENLPYFYCKQMTRPPWRYLFKKARKKWPPCHFLLPRFLLKRACSSANTQRAIPGAPC